MMIMMCEYDPGTFVESGGRIVINQQSTLRVMVANVRYIDCFERQTHVQSFKTFYFMKDP